MADIGICCVVCGRPLRNGDDRVVCPLCGAPYHRGCYPASGCRFADRHGDGFCWRPPLRRQDEDACVCPNCGSVCPQGAQRCPHCGVPFSAPEPVRLPPEVSPDVFYADFSPYIGIAPDSRLDGCRAVDTALFLGPNAGYYLAQFFRLSLGKSSFSWNWAAALFPLEWALYRKQYCLFAALSAVWLPAAALGAAALFWAFPQLSLPATLSLLTGSSGTAFPLAPWILWQVSAFIRWCVRVFAATRGNHYYRRLAARRIRTVPDGTEDVRRQALRRLGGVSWPLPVVFDAICAGFTLLGLAIGGKI